MMKFIGKKQGMTQIFDKNGNVVTCTVILVEPHFVAQIKTKENDGYEALQLATCKKKKSIKRPQLEFFKKINMEPCKNLIESKVDISSYKVGDEVKFDCFKEGDFVDVVGISKGKGYQGVMKLHGFRGGPGAHGSGFHRHAGSTGMRSSPGRCFPGGPRASHMGVDRVTVQNMKIVLVSTEKNLVVVKGSIPGANGEIVHIVRAKKKGKKA